VIYDLIAKLWSPVDGRGHAMLGWRIGGKSEIRVHHFDRPVECTVNQLINWRMCKKQQMGWPGRSPRNLLYVKNRDH
jgi:hypothetical protein